MPGLPHHAGLAVLLHALLDQPLHPIQDRWPRQCGGARAASLRLLVMVGLISRMYNSGLRARP